MPFSMPEPTCQSVLLVDDDPLLLKVNARVLGREFHVCTVSSAEAALDLVRAGTWFDAILCDLCLPGMTGDELFEGLRDDHPVQATRFAILSGLPTIDANARVVQALGDRWLEKPIRPAELRMAALRIAGRRDAA
jgi:two-component system NtrC family sensor kinase